MLSEVARHLRFLGESPQFFTILGFAAAYGVAAGQFARRSLAGLTNTHMVLGLAAVTLALLNRFEGGTLLTMLAMESVIFAWAGFRFALPALRRFGYFIGVSAAIQGVPAVLEIGRAIESSAPVQAPLLIGAIAAVTGTALIAGLARSPVAEDSASSRERRLVLNWFAFFAGALCALAAPVVAGPLVDHATGANIGVAAETDFNRGPIWLSGAVIVPLLWSIQCAVTAGLAHVLRSPFFHVMAALGFWITGWAALFCHPPSALCTAAVGGTLFWVAALYRRSAAAARLAQVEPSEPAHSDSAVGTIVAPATGQAGRSGKVASGLYLAGAVVVLTLGMAGALKGAWLAAFWAAEGLALIAAGFMIREKMLRISGLLVFALLMGKLLFFDLAGTDTLYRIVSFIVAGVVLLAASYGYNWFARKAETK